MGGSRSGAVYMWLAPRVPRSCHLTNEYVSLSHPLFFLSSLHSATYQQYQTSLRNQLLPSPPSSFCLFLLIFNHLSSPPPSYHWCRGPFIHIPVMPDCIPVIRDWLHLWLQVLWPACHRSLITAPQPQHRKDERVKVLVSVWDSRWRHSTTISSSSHISVLQS